MAAGAWASSEGAEPRTGRAPTAPQLGAGARSGVAVPRNDLRTALAPAGEER
jgi:hypothetical protein